MVIHRVELVLGVVSTTVVLVASTTVGSLAATVPFDTAATETPSGSFFCIAAAAVVTFEDATVAGTEDQSITVIYCYVPVPSDLAFTSSSFLPSTIVLLSFFPNVAATVVVVMFDS